MRRGGTRPDAMDWPYRQSEPVIKKIAGVKVVKIMYDIQESIQELAGNAITASYPNRVQKEMV